MEYRQLIQVAQIAPENQKGYHHQESSSRNDHMGVPANCGEVDELCLVEN